MSKSFDPQQQAILDSTAQRQLVNAGAGSGKTTVMIQKIADLLLNNKVTTNELLVVTFTNLASIEMRERLVAKISEELTKSTDEQEKTRIQNILDGIETASVDTIDGFCSKMLKKYFYQANLDPEIKIISSFSQEYYINKALDLAIKKFNEANEKDLIVLCDIFEKKSRSLDSLKENLLKAFNYCVCQKDYDSFLNKILPQYKDLNSTSACYLNKHIFNNITENANQILKLLPNFTDFPKLHKMMDCFCSHLIKVSDTDLSTTINILTQCEMYNLQRTEHIKDNFDYDKLKFHAENLKKLINDTKFLHNLDKFALDNISHHLTSFVELLKLFIHTYANLKRENGVMDFSDLERKMLDILQNEAIIKDFHDTYKYIFVDEYQDINPMQDELINTLLNSSSNLFLVGDVKQSIYGFRQSTPELFIQTYKNYKQDSALGTAFDMKINFRSAPQILEFNNDIFCKLMTEKDADIDYSGTGKFAPRNHDFPTSRAVEIYAINTDNQPDQLPIQGIYSVKNHRNPLNICDPDEYEIHLVINKIKELIGSEIYDSKLKENRTVEYSDIAILSRGIVNEKVQNLAKTLTKHNIPININKNTNVKDSEGVNKILAILKILNFTASDIDYVYLFTSPLINLTYEEILNIYTNHNLNLHDNLNQYANTCNDNLSIKIKYGFNLCDEFRIISSTMNVIELIETILNKYHLRQHLIASDKGYEQLNILDEFLNSLSNEEKNLSISKFIDLIEKNLNSSNQIVARDSINSVTIQTIHASKGLEYPIVILFNCGQQFTYLNEHNELNFDLDLGVGMQYYDLTSRKRLESPTRYAIKLKNKEKAYKEELRLLYVATTRAKNKLIITGCCSDDKLMQNTLSKDCFINLILSAYYGQINAHPLASEYDFTNCHISLLNYVNIDYIEKQNENKSLCNDNLIENNINFNYPYMEETNISIKNNVTAISRTLNDEYNIAPVRLNLNENLQATTDDLAQIGTQYHNSLANIDYSCPYIYQNEDNDIDQNLIQLAHTKISPIAKGCIKQYNEKQFMMYVPYNEIYKDSNVSSKILVQGIIDLILEFDTHVILIDYKYSSSSIKTLRERYHTQLELYKLALEKALKKPVTQSYIYSIKTGDLG
ncbi:MAG: UvrD-helicase domain-containing protein [Clostridia bacterium]|nr:UvrD-helicase domain-containing protein [Clostridia bacterium]